MRMSRQCMSIMACAALVAAATPTGAVPVPLGSYNVDLRESSVSGISSGGYMAQQFHVAYSSLLRGAGIVAGGPYYCAQGNVAIALTSCTTPTALNPPDVAQSLQATRSAEQAAQIDPTAYLGTSRVWLFSGTRDETVFPIVVDRLYEYYRHFVPAENIFYEKTVPAAHAMITEHYGHPCDYKGNGDNPNDIFINDCDYDAAGRILAHIYGPLNPKAASLSGVFVEFPQEEFLADPVAHSMNPTGYAYVPESCEDGAPCRVHVVFHGCRQQPARIGDRFYRNVGYNEWADTNRIIVLYPQAINSDLPPVYNPRGCWDWWGYDDPNYHTKGGRQMLAVRGMLGRLASGFHPSPPTAPADVAVTSMTDRSVGLRWGASAGTPRVIGYHVYVAGQSGGPYARVNSTPIASTEYTVTGLNPGTNYYFVVRAVNKRGMESADSLQVSATTSLLPPLLPW
ncbi:MAG: fibronectin type III domain-containing protein [Pseudomonadota bacterium]